MLIQIGNIYMNDTWKFLIPVLKEYGDEFVWKFNSVWKVAVGIGDMILVKSNIRYEQHLFVLLDSKSGKKHFIDFMKWIKDQEMFEDDYAYDNINSGRFHMVVIKMPPSGYKSIENFRHSQFSKMFTVDEVNKYFKDNPDVKKVIVKDKKYRLEYVDKLNHLFDTKIQPDEFEGELSLPIRKSKEIFNIKRKKA